MTGTQGQGLLLSDRNMDLLLSDKGRELLCITLWPLYLPCRFVNVVICVVYVPPDGKTASAAAQVSECVQQQLQCTPSGPLFVLGDMNHGSLERFLAGFQQYVKRNTRNNNMLEKYYGNISSK